MLAQTSWYPIVLSYRAERPGRETPDQHCCAEHGSTRDPFHPEER